MFKLVLTAITSAVLLLTPSPSRAQSNNSQLTGTVAYRERMALPSDAVIDVQLVDTSIADIAVQTVAEVLINAEGRQVPVPFTLTYDPAQIVPAHRYSVRATIRSGDGMLMFSTTQAYPVLTHGAPSKVNLILHTVGHGAHPAVSAKKQPAPIAAESAASASQSVPPATSESAPAVTTGTAPATPPSSESAPSATTPGTPEPANSTAQAEAKPAATETAAVPPPSTLQEPASPPPAPIESTAAPTASIESTPSETAPATGESSSGAAASQSAPAPTETTPPAPPAMEQQTPPAETPTTVAAPAPESESSSHQSNPAEAQPATPEQTIPPESKSESTTLTPEAKAAAPEAPLPEAPSASKRAELEASAPDTVPEPEAESTSRPERPAPNKALTPLADTQWKLVQLNGQDVVIAPPQKPVTLAFSPEGRRIAGSAGCNSYLGTFTDDHGRLHLSPGNMTMMMCADPAGSREKKFVAMLRSADGYKINGDFLLLTSNGKTVAKFKNNQY